VISFPTMVSVFTIIMFFPQYLLSISVSFVSILPFIKNNNAIIQYLNIPAEPAPLPDFVGERLGAEPKESDMMHDMLAHPAEHMTEMNKEKNAEIKSYSGFFDGETGADAGDMAN